MRYKPKGQRLSAPGSWQRTIAGAAIAAFLACGGLALTRQATQPPVDPVVSARTGPDEKEAEASKDPSPPAAPAVAEPVSSLAAVPATDAPIPTRETDPEARAQAEPPFPAAGPGVAEIQPSAPEPRTVPLPVPRPAEFRRLAPAVTARIAVGSAARRARRQVATAPPPAGPVNDERSFIEKLFGIEPEGRPAPALAYAALETKPIEDAFRKSLSVVVPPPTGGGTAIYDIAARKVTLPSGEVLEAHSGLGEHMDSPDHVHVRMKGSTPPGTYDLTERERPFHGVRAIRLNPVGGSAAIHGRDGLLAHTYMLGPSGASNGCVSFKNYDRFLQAYLKGEVARLVVVSGRG